MDEFIDLSLTTQEQSFAFMLLERIENLEEDNEKLKELVFPKPIVIADSAKALYEELLEYRNTFDHCVIAAKETGPGLVPESVFALLPKEAQRDARNFAKLTADDVLYKQFVFLYPIEILKSCKETCAPEVVSWIKELTLANVKKLKVNND